MSENSYNETDLEWFESIGDEKNAAIAREHIARAKEVSEVLDRTGIKREDVENKTNPNVPTSLMDLVTAKQLNRISALNGPGLDIAAKCIEIMGCKPEELSQTAADAFIKKLVLMPRSSEPAPSADVTTQVPTAQAAAAGSGIPSVASVIPTVMPANAGPAKGWESEFGSEYARAHAHAESIGSEEFPDYPTQLVKSIVKGDGIISKETVESVLAEFALTVNLDDIASEAKAIVVTDSSQKPLMKTARELRLRIRKERIRIEHQRVDVKEPYLRRVQVIDGVGKYLRDLMQELEDHLKLQEDFEKLEAQRIADHLDAERIKDLQENFEWKLPVEMLGQNILGKMTEGEWVAYRTGVEGKWLVAKAETEAAEEERKRREEAAQRENDRTKRLVELGLHFNGRFFVKGDISIDLENVRPASDEAFERLLSEVGPRVAAIIADEEQKKAAAERTQSRINRLAEIGMRWNGSLYRYDGFEKDGEIDQYAVETLEDDKFEMFIDFWKPEIEKDKAAKAAEEARLLEIAEQDAAAAAEAERLRLAPTKDKLIAYATSIESLPRPTVDASVITFLDDIEAELQAIALKIRNHAESL